MLANLGNSVVPGLEKVNFHSNPKERQYQGILHAKMSKIKDRNGMDLTEAEDIKKSGKNTQNCTKKIFMTQIIMMA